MLFRHPSSSTLCRKLASLSNSLGSISSARLSPSCTSLSLTQSSFSLSGGCSSKRNSTVDIHEENNWLRLLKPRKSFEDTVRSILITVQFLHYVKRNPETSYKSLCTHLSKVFSLYDVRRSHNDLLDHILLIRDSVERDDTLARSKFLVNFLGEKPAKRQLSDEGIQGTKDLRFVDDHIKHDMIDDAENESSDIDSLFSSVCAFCDDGGDLLCCEGRCLRSFHPTVESADGKTLENELEVVKGMKLDRGYISPYFITNQNNQKCELENPLIIIHEKKISSINVVVKVLELVLQNQSYKRKWFSPLLIENHLQL
ncbi:unnamed protein product [Prunus armeniaca]|uniref:Uncharacterized protein n=1 Tax=Prunus armeniaca TaxID=36596 RepID=A0A6J5XKD9_PRUAR|nr:unnamed protein product [Prunus armeniaca]